MIFRQFQTNFEIPHGSDLSLFISKKALTTRVLLTNRVSLTNRKMHCIYFSNKFLERCSALLLVMTPIRNEFHSYHSIQEFHWRISDFSYFSRQYFFHEIQYSMLAQHSLRLDSREAKRLKMTLFLLTFSWIFHVFKLIVSSTMKSEISLFFWRFQSKWWRLWKFDLNPNWKDQTWQISSKRLSLQLERKSTLMCVCGTKSP